LNKYCVLIVNMKIPLQELLLLERTSYSVLLNGKIIYDWTSLKEDDPYEVRVKLCGGKGGFGSLLRSFGSQFYRSTNRDMCRDLSGRRLKNKKDEDRLRKYIEVLTARRKMMRKRMEERYERLKKVPTHNFDDTQYSQSKKTILEETDNALKEGLSAKNKNVKNTDVESDAAEINKETEISVAKSAIKKEKNVSKLSTDIRGSMWIGVDLSEYHSDSSDNEISDENSKQILLILCFSVAINEASKLLYHINEDNWKQILKDEWMIEFHAPWCPACKDLSKAWSSFAEWSKDLKIKVAEVDVTSNPGLSGRFLVTALPTILHVKDGTFRIYTGARDKEDFVSFIEKKKWTIVDPLPSWKHPDSFQMGIVSLFFKLSMAVRDLHVTLIEKYGLSSWMSYSLFGFITLFLGCVLGFVIVFIIDRVFPTKLPSTTTTKVQKKGKAKNRKTNDKSSGDSAPHSESEHHTNEDNTRRRKSVKAE
ncbi:Thioredoxin-related transmembrane protein 1, partial [Trichinella zimbabwensis]